MSSPSKGSSRSTLIYIVDDEQLNLDMAEVALMGRGYAVKKFNDPAEAYASFTGEDEKPRLLLTDYAMGSMNGLELSEKCRAAAPSLKVLMLSGTVGEEIALEAPVRVDHFMAKPYHPGALADAVETLLRA